MDSANKEQATSIPSMLFLSEIALVLAQMPIATKLKGTRTLGMFAVYLFLAVIGALCDIEALRALDVGVRLFVFVLVRTELDTLLYEMNHGLAIRSTCVCSLPQRPSSRKRFSTRYFPTCGNVGRNYETHGIKTIFRT